MPKKLTDIAIQNLKPQSDRYEVPDSGARGLRVIVQPSGFKSFAVRYRDAAGRARKLTLAGGVSLAVARKLAADALLEVAQGRDPATAKQQARRGAKSKAGDTVERLAEQYIEQYAKRRTRQNSWRGTVAVFRNDVLPAWGKRNVHEIRRRDVIEILDAIALDRPIMANRARSALSHFFRWLADRDVIAASPCIGIRAPAPAVVRDRMLDDDEIRRLWRAADRLDDRVGICIKLLILTGQRRSEIACLRWSEVNGDVLVLPVERMKGKQAHVLPLSTQAAALVESMPRDGEFVFGTPITRFARIKQRLDAHMGDVPAWTVHDIRRSVASGLARLGVSLPVIEKILAHRGGSFKGVVGIYQRHSFLQEMTVAMQWWADHVEELVAGPKAPKVVRLRKW
jgi:integrase